MRLPPVVLAFSLLLPLVACGGDDDGGGVTIDAAPAPSMITVMGRADTVMGTSTQPLAGATITAHTRTGTTALATATSAADGTYTLNLTTDGTAIDGYLKGTSAGRLDTYLYPPRPLGSNVTGATMLIINSGTLDLLGTLGGVNQDQTKGFIGVIVRDASAMPVAGATVTISPMGTARIIYAVNSLPNQNATMTDATGTVYIANTNVGEITVDATMGATAYFEHAVTARAGVITTTAIEP